MIYDSSTFLEHNLDEGLAPALAALLGQSSNALVASLFAASAEESAAAAPAATAVNNSTNDGHYFFQCDENLSPNAFLFYSYPPLIVVLLSHPQVSAFNQALDGVLSILAPPNEAPPDLHYIRCLKSNFGMLLY